MITHHIVARTRMPAAVLLVACLLPRIASAQFYRLVELGGPAGGSVRAYAINSIGQTTGFLETPEGVSHAFIGNQAQLTDVTPGSASSESYGQAINATGMIAGLLRTATDRRDAAFVHANGATTLLGNLGGGVATAFAINGAGQVVGKSTTGSGESHAFLYSDGAMIDLGALDGESSSATAINDVGHVTGFYTKRIGMPPWSESRPFLYRDGAIARLGAFVGAGRGINNSGQVTGDFLYGGRVSHAFLYSNGQLIDLDRTDLYATRSSSGLAINSKGHVTGFVATPTTGRRGFAYRGERVMMQLDGMLIADDPLRPFVSLTEGVAINDSDWRVANGVDSRTGETRSYLLLPNGANWLTIVPEVLQFPEQSGGVRSMPRVVTVTNSGATPLVLGIDDTGGDFSQLNDCGTSLGPGASCSIEVTFLPSSAGEQTGGLSISSPTTATQSVQLTGKGIVASTLTANAHSLTAGDSLTLTWTASSLASCTGSGGTPGDGWEGPKGTVGTQTVVESVQGPVKFSIHCTWGSESADASILVMVRSRKKNSGSLELISLALLLVLSGLRLATAAPRGRGL